MPKSEPKFDKRLLGTWKSDRRKTFEHFKPRRGLTASKFRKYKALFGKMTVRWSRGKFLLGFGDAPADPKPYTIIGRDETSVIVQYETNLWGQSFTHIHFEGDDWYWLALPFGTHIEWFRRVE